MTDRYYIGSEADCKTVMRAQDIVYNMPLEPRTPPPNSQPVLSPQVRDAQIAAWFALTQEQREDETYWSPWLAQGWALRQQSLFRETAPGTRVYTFVPDNIVALMEQAAIEGRILSLEYATALTTALALSVTELPQDWTPPED